MCSVKNIDLCEGTKKEDILKYHGMSLEGLQQKRKHWPTRRVKLSWKLRSLEQLTIQEV